MLHEPNTSGQESDPSSQKKARLGVIFFFIYFFFYGGFVTIGVVNYELLAIDTVGGLNLATFYGLGLIIFAVFLGILYNYFCSKYEDEMKEPANEKGDQI